MPRHGLIGDPLLSLARSLYEESMRWGIPAIEYDDALAVYALAYSVLVGKREALVVDAGAGIGYSTVWLAKAVRDACRSRTGRCRLVAIEYYGSRAERLRQTIEEVKRLTGIEASVWVGDAIDYFSRLPVSSIDFTLVDIDKDQYPEAVRILASRLKPGGIAVFHNAFIPSPPPEFYDALEAAGLPYTIIPTELGLAVMAKPTS